MVDTDDSVVFVEVKTRANEDFADAESAITAAKKKRLARAAKYFVTIHDIDNRPMRFDLVTVVLGRKGSVCIRHYENALSP